MPSDSPVDEKPWILPSLVLTNTRPEPSRGCSRSIAPDCGPAVTKVAKVVRFSTFDESRGSAAWPWAVAVPASHPTARTTARQTGRTTGPLTTGLPFDVRS